MTRNWKTTCHYGSYCLRVGEGGLEFSGAGDAGDPHIRFHQQNEYHIIFFFFHSEKTVKFQTYYRPKKKFAKCGHWAVNCFKQTLKFHGLKLGATVINITEEYIVILNYN